MGDREFLQWIHDRMIHVHGENENADYMHKLRAIIDGVSKGQVTPNVCSKNNAEPGFSDWFKEQP